MADKFWKQKERRIARMFGTTRIGMVTGKHQPDFIAPGIVGEVFTAKHSKKILQELGQAEKAAAESAVYLLPVGIMAEKGGKDKDSLVFMRLEKFLALWKVLERRERIEAPDPPMIFRNFTDEDLTKFIRNMEETRS